MGEKLSNVVLVCGSDDFLVLQEGRQIYSEKSADGDDFSNEVINGQAQNLGELEQIVENFRSAVQTLPMFGANKTIWFKDINFLGDTTVGRTEGAKKLLATIQEILAPLVNQPIFILMTASPIDRRTREFKWFQENVSVNYIEAGSSKESLDGVLTLECKKRKLMISEDAKELFLQKVNNNTRALFCELEKVDTYLGPMDRTITKKLVSEMVCDFGGDDFFELCDAFYSKNLTDSLTLLRKYFFINKEARPLIAALQNRNRLIIQLKVLLDSNMISLAAKGGLSKTSFETAMGKYEGMFHSFPEKTSYCVFTQNIWYLGNLAKTAVNFSLKSLIDFQLRFNNVLNDLLKYPNEQENTIRQLFLSCMN